MQHLQLKHPACKDKPLEFFQEDELKVSQNCLTASCSKQEQMPWPSYHVAHRIAKAKTQPHSSLKAFLPTAMDMVREVLDQSGKLKTILFSNDTIASLAY